MEYNRITDLKKGINLLKEYRKRGDFSKFKESEIIIAICELEEEVEKLEGKQVNG